MIPQAISDDALELLMQYRWPGNVRELENFAERCSILHPTEEIGVDALPDWMVGDIAAPQSNYMPTIWNYKEAKADFERKWLKALLKDCDGNMAQAARQADMDRAQFFRLAKKYSLTKSEVKSLE